MGHVPAEPIDVVGRGVTGQASEIVGKDEGTVGAVGVADIHRFRQAVEDSIVPELRSVPTEIDRGVGTAGGLVGGEADFSTGKLLIKTVADVI